MSSQLSELTTSESRQPASRESSMPHIDQKTEVDVNEIPVRFGQSEEQDQIIYECIGIATERYAAEGFTGLDALYENSANSDYFFLRNPEGEIVITASQIRVPDEGRGDFRFPIEEAAKDHLYEGVAEDIARSREDAPEAIVEVSGLARKKGTEGVNEKALDLYREMWEYSRYPNEGEEQPKHEVWVALIEKGLDDSLEYAFGSYAMQKVGNQFVYEGGETTPYVIHLDRCVEGLVGRYHETKEQYGDAGAEFFKQAVMDHLILNLNPDCLRSEEKELLIPFGYDL